MHTEGWFAHVSTEGIQGRIGAVENRLGEGRDQLSYSEGGVETKAGHVLSICKEVRMSVWL